MVPTKDKLALLDLSAMNGWEIASHFGIDYIGDGSPIPHGGFFYNVKQWEQEGKVKILDLYMHPDPQRKNHLVVQFGTLRKPKDDHERRSIAECMAQFSHEANNPHHEIEAVRYHMGGTWDNDYPGARTFNLDTWREWRIWRSITDMLNEIKAQA